MSVIPHECFQAVFTSAVRITHMSGDALDVRKTLYKPAEDLVLLFVAWLERYAVLDVSFCVVIFVIPEVIRFDAEEHVT